MLVTGATGLLGRAVVRRLLQRNHAVAALHRADAAIPPWTGGPLLAGEMAGVQGDLVRPALGLAAPADLARQLDLIVHCAAATSFALSPAIYSAVNVEGVARLLHFAEHAATRPIPLLHTSTAYVCGNRDGPIDEAELDAGQAFANPYEASKAAAERLVAAAVRRGLPAAVARPSIIVGAWADGAISRFDGLYGLIRLVVEGRVRILPSRPDASLDLVPIDHVAGGLVDIAERMREAAGRTFHLVSGEPVPVDLLRILALQYEQFHVPTFVTPEHFDPAQLNPAERGWHRRVAQFYSSYLLRNPWFRDGNLRALGLPSCPPVDLPFLRRMIDFAVASGFLPIHRTSG